MIDVEIKKVHSKHFRKRTGDIEYIILHCSAFSIEKQLELLDEYKLSVHYIIGQNGDIVENLDTKFVAYHAGISSWNGSLEKSLNEYSIGIELEAPTLGQLKSDFTQKQFESLVYLLNKLVKKHKIKRENILGHSDISPTLKPDPGVGFFWKELACKGFGVWYDRRTLSKITDEKELLVRIGYNIDNIYATRHQFCRHFLGCEANFYKDVKILVDEPYICDFLPINFDKYLKTLRAVAQSFDKSRNNNI
ncbi:MAG: N-acetylmuramoyl-L-alanine amidase [Alphaproteobacteria bacterium]|nr:N-acetylmuramoyl-L-alanine amidase [Alphaproteobacteria bacterium]